MKSFSDLIFTIILLVSSCNSSQIANLKKTHQILLQTQLHNKQNTNTTVKLNLPNLQSSSEIDSFFVTYGPCSPDVCPAPNGYCSSSNKCTCAEGFSNSNVGQKRNGKYCQYVQKKQITAFFLELFFFSGIGHLYAGRLSMGITKLIFTLIFFIFYGILKYKLNKDTKGNLFQNEEEEHENVSEDMEKYLGFLFCFLCCGLLIWQLVDIVLFGMNKYSDGDGVPLSSW